MTYCVGLLLDAGIVMLSDTRTNAGVDNIAIYRKMFVYEEPGERALVMLTSGNLSITQTVMAKLEHAIEDPEATGATSILLAETMLEIAEIVGRTLNEVSVAVGDRMSKMNQSVTALILLGGQRKGGQAHQGAVELHRCLLWLCMQGGRLGRRPQSSDRCAPRTPGVIPVVGVAKATQGAWWPAAQASTVPASAARSGASKPARTPSRKASGARGLA